MSDSCEPMTYSLPGSSVHEILQVRILAFLLQGIFPTQGLNLGLPHRRQILYLLSQRGLKDKLEELNTSEHTQRTAKFIYNLIKTIMVSFAFCCGDLGTQQIRNLKICNRFTK